MLTVDTFVGILSFGVACFGLYFALGSIQFAVKKRQSDLDYRVFLTEMTAFSDEFDIMSSFFPVIPVISVICIIFINSSSNLHLDYMLNIRNSHPL